MNISIPSKYTAFIQEYIADSIIQSIIEGSIIIFIVLFFEFIQLKKSKILVHHIYKSLLVGLVLMSLFGRAIIPIQIDNNLIIVLSKYSPKYWYWINIFWLSGVCVLFGKWLLSKYFLNQLVKTSDQNFPGFWVDLLDQCKQKVNTKSNLILAHSQKIQSAFVTGILKPIIIFPTSWINGLSKEEAEYILIHEMSHLKSKDHYFNAICSFAEIVLFFNPAVYFIINRIKLQREICADSFVVQQLKRPIEYASLLVKIGEISIPKTSIAFGSIKAQLTVRVKEILDLHQPRVNHSRVLLLSILCILIAIVFMKKVEISTVQNPNSLCIENTECTVEFAQSNECRNIPALRIKSFNKSSALSSTLKATNVVDQMGEMEGMEAFIDMDLKDSLFKGKSWKFLLNKDTYTISNSLDSSNIILVINSGLDKEATTNSFVKRMLGNSRNFMEKEWKEQYPNSSNLIKYILIKDQSKTILSYSNMQQSMYQISTVN